MLASIYYAINSLPRLFIPVESTQDSNSMMYMFRRQFCGMVVGLDQAINRVTNNALEILGDNTVVVVSSDNGGSVWFGGMNAPFRSGKLTAFEGGVRVPAFAIDLSKDKRYLGQGGREFKNMIHISDWLPTFLSWSNSTALLGNTKMDGIDQSRVNIIILILLMSVQTKDKVVNAKSKIIFSHS